MAIQKKKKRFFKVEIPLIRKETQVLAFAPEELEGKLIKYDLTRILKGKGSLLQVQIKKQDNSELLTTSPRQFQVLPFFIKRMIRKSSNYVEDSFSTNCKDAQIRLKPFLITRRKVPRAVRKALRNACKNELEKYVKNMPKEKVFENILKGILQKDLSLKLKKIYPLSLCEIRIIKVEKELSSEEKPKKQDLENSEKEEKKEEVLDKKIQENIKTTSETKSESENPEQEFPLERKTKPKTESKKKTTSKKKKTTKKKSK